MTIYGIFMNISDYEFSVDDVLARDKDGNFLVFLDEEKAKINLPKNELDRYHQGTIYEIKPLNIIN